MGAKQLDQADSDWISALRRDPPGDAATRQLSVTILAGLRKGFASRSGVTDADLEDFTQEALTRVLDRLDSFRGDSKFTTWALAIAFRVGFTALRRRNDRERQADEHELIERSGADTRREHTRDPRTVSQHRSLLAALSGAIDQVLTPRQRSAVLAELDGVPTAVVAEQLGTNQNALYKLCHDARKKLRAELEQHGFSAADLLLELEGTER